MGNISTLEFDKQCDNILTIDNILTVDNIDFHIDCYIENRQFNIKLTKKYKLDIYEHINIGNKNKQLYIV